MPFFIKLFLILFFLDEANLWLIDSSCPCCVDVSLECFKRKTTTSSTTSTTTTTTTTTTLKTNTTTKKPNPTILPICCDSSSSGSSESRENGVILAIGIHNKVEEKDCSLSDCNSNGHCFGKISEPMCLCRIGYCGIRCNTTVCFGDQGCNGHGWCLATNNSSKCICRNGWSGKFCDKKE